MKKVGVVIPVFGHSRFLRDSFASAMCQQGVDTEAVIVCDGCLNTDTHEFLVSLEGWRRGKVTIVRKANGGLSAARNSGIEALLGGDSEYFYFLDADNVISEFSLYEGVKDLERSGADWAYPNINSLGYCKPDALVSGDFNPYLLAARNFIEAGSLVSRRVFDSGLRFDDRMFAGYEDWEFWLSAVSHGFVGVQSAGLGLRYRHRFESMIADADRSKDKLIEIMRSKHREFYAPDNLYSLERNFYPRFGIIDVRSKRYFENSFENELRFDQFTKRLNDGFVPGGLNGGPEFLLFVDMARVSLSREVDSLRNVLGVFEEIASESVVCPLGLQVTNGRQFGVRLGRSSSTELAGLFVRNQLFLEVLRDSDEWILSQIANVDNAEQHGLTIVGEFPPFRSDGAFVREFVSLLAELRQNCAVQYQRGSLSGVHLAHAPETPFSSIAAELPVYPHPCSPLSRTRPSKRRRRIGFVLPFGTYGGVERVAIDVAKVLTDRGFECHVFFEFTGVIHPDFLLKRSFKSVTYLTSGSQMRWSPDVNYLGTVGAIIDDDVVRRCASMLMGMDEVVFCNSHLAIACAGDLRKLGVRTSSYVHTFDVAEDGRLVGWPFFTIGYEHKIDRIYACSPTMHNDMLMLGAPKDKLMCINNATTFKPIRRRGSVSDPIRLSFVGRFDLQKGIERLVPIVAELRARGVAFRLRMAGSAVLGGCLLPKELEEFVIGQLDSKEVGALLDDTDVLLIPSRWEGLPLVMLEAMARGVVPLSAPVGDVPRVAHECPGVVLVDWEDCVEVVDQISRVSTLLPELRAKLYEWSRENCWEKNIPAAAFC